VIDLENFIFRVGVHCGYVFSGIFGHSKFQFDVFGHTVSVTDALERGGKIWAVNVSQEVKNQLDICWKHQIPNDLIIRSWLGYQYRNLHGKSYLISRKRWIDANGEVSVQKADDDGPAKAISTLSILSQFAESKGDLDTKRPPRACRDAAGALRLIHGAAVHDLQGMG